MGGGSKTNTTTTTQTKNPWEPAMPGLQKLLDDTMSVYGSGQGSQVYQGPRVAGIGSTTQAGLDAMKANAGAGQAAAQAGNAGLTQLLQNNGATAGTTSATNGLLNVGPVSTAGVQAAADRMGNPNSAAATVGRNLIGGQYAQDATGYQDLASNLGQTTQTQRSLSDVASGKFLQEGGNPYADAIAGESAAQAASKVAQAFASRGAYGSGRFASATADAVARAENEARYSNYNFERQQQAAAASAIDSQANARTGSLQSLFDAMNNTRTANAGQAVTGANLASQADQAALTGANALAALQGQNNQQRIGQYTTALGSAQSDRAAQLAALGQVATNNANLLAPGQTLAKVGAVEDAARQEQLNAAQQLFAEQQAQPWKQIGLASSIVQPIASLGGQATGTEVKQIPQPSLFQQILGGAMQGASALGATNAFGNAGGAAAGAAGAAGAGAGLGGSAGWLSMLFSDERLKDDVEPVGETFDHQPIYRYRMKDGGPMQMGLLAHQVADRHPGAVGEGPLGLLMVDYGQATDDAAKLAKGAHSGFGFSAKDR